MKLIDYQTGTYDPTVEAYAVQVLQGDGIYDVRKCGCATMMFKVCDHQFVSLPTTLKEGIVLNVPKMPHKIFNDLLAFYRHIYNLYKSEVYVAVFYDAVKKEFFNYVPKQTVSGALAKISEAAGQELNDMREKFILVLETHSHNIMTGHFSGIDDRDQTIPDVIHLVIGDIHKESPTYQIRVALGNKKVDLKFTDIFETDGYQLNLAEFPNWKEHINESTRSNPLDALREYGNRLSSAPVVAGSMEDELPFAESYEEYLKMDLPQEQSPNDARYFEHRITKNYIRA